jgi:hypothetical protein
MLYPENIPDKLEVLLMELVIELKASFGVAPSPSCRRPNLPTSASLRKREEANRPAVKTKHDEYWSFIEMTLG